MNILKKDFYYPSSSKEHSIYARSWMSDNSKDIKAVLQIAHGMAEHSDRYDDFAHYMASQGFAVYANDHAGHGNSLNKDKDLGYFSENDGRYHLVEDMYTLTKIAKEQNNKVPYFLLGHSMGSFLSRSYAVKHGNELSAAIFMGTGGPNTLIDVAIILSKRLMSIRGEKAQGRIMDRLAFGNFNKEIKNPQTSFDWLSTNKENVKNFLNDKLSGFMFTYSAFYQLFSLIKEVTNKSWGKEFPVKLPVLFISGKNDPVGNYGKGVDQSAELLMESGVEDVSVKLYEGMRHEILNEKENLQVYEYISQWLEKYIPS
jgi:alpha-beta hydrolase superfamily lysophospholipase